MRAVKAALAVIALGVAVIAATVGMTVPASASGGNEVETQALVQSQLRALKTTDGIRIKDAACRPITWHFSIQDGNRIFSDLWTCYLSDALDRMYNVNAHVRNTPGGGLDRITVLFCLRSESKFACPPGAKIILPS